MSVQRNLWNSWVFTAGVLMVGAFPAVSLCQSVSDQDVEKIPTKPIEEIVVYGERSLPNLRREVYRKEEHVCRANFVKDATAADYEGWRKGLPVIPAYTVIMQKKRRLGLKMELLAAEHPELLEALNEYSNAKHVLKSEMQKCEGMIVCRR